MKNGKCPTALGWPGGIGKCYSIFLGYSHWHNGSTRHAINTISPQLWPWPGSGLNFFPLRGTNSNTAHPVQVRFCYQLKILFLPLVFCRWAIHEYFRLWITAKCQRILSWINQAGALQRSLSPIPVGPGLSVWPALSPTSLSAVLFSVTESYFLLFWRNSSKEKPQPVMYKILQISLQLLPTHDA